MLIIPESHMTRRDLNMPEQTEKLLHFTEEVVRNAAQQSEQMKAVCRSGGGQN